MKFIKPEKISLKLHPELNEKWVQERIAEDPKILGLGDLILKDKERIHPKAGRLDLLFQDAESSRRYEVELQLGATDESHIMRTIEYWDIERKLYPKYNHCAVIIAEDITSRFLNVISLFNRQIPLVAIQMGALKIEDGVALVFTTVMDERTLGQVEEEEELEVTDRAYWETKRGSKETISIADDLLEMVHSFAPDLTLKYNKFYIGLAKDGQPNNFVIFRATKSHLRLEVRLEQSDEIQRMLDNTGLDVMDYNKNWSRYRIRLTKKDIIEKEGVLTELMKIAYDKLNG